MFRQKRKRGDIWRYRLLPVLAVLALLTGLLVARLVTLMNTSLDDVRLVYVDKNWRVHALHLQTGRDEILADETRTARVHVTQSYSPDGNWLIEWSELSLTLTHVPALQQRPVPASYSMLTSPPAWLPDSSAFVISAVWGGDGLSASELLLMDVAGSSITQLTSNRELDMYPSFNPDGTQLAYASAFEGKLHLYIMDLATRASRRVSPESFGAGALWSPDGKWIAFESKHLDTTGSRDEFDIFIIAPDGSNLQRLTWNAGWNRIVGWEMAGKSG